jgi:hypothetical protein
MRLYYRPADRKPHAHAARFRGEKWFKNAIDMFRIDSRAGILDQNDYLVGFAELRPYDDDSLAARHGAHGFAGIHD